MRSFIDYIKDYLRHLSLKSFLFTFLFVAILVAVNYTTGIERRIRDIHPWYLSLMSFFFFYGFVFLFAWAMQYSFGSVSFQEWAPRGAARKRFLLLLLLGPLFFAFKMIHWDLSPLLPASWTYPWNRYALIILQLPAKLLLLLLLLLGCRRLIKAGKDDAGVHAPNTPLFGLSIRNFKAGPYFLLLACMVPLIALASTRPDFLHTYPKVKNIAFLSGYAHPLWPWQLLYELSYGLDFLSIELFFRGLLVVGLVHYAGRQAILPMAAFYCTIHFGKPLGECISSFFGGLILGVIAARTRSIFGGLIVHLGLAWLMELGGWLGGM